MGWNRTANTSVRFYPRPPSSTRGVRRYFWIACAPQKIANLTANGVESNYRHGSTVLSPVTILMHLH